MAMLVDAHQHIWTQELVAALEQRTQPPFVRYEDGCATLYSAGEPPYPLDLDAEAPARRAALVRADGVEVAVVAISSPVGIEALPRAEAQPLIEAHLEGVMALPDEFGAWGPFALEGARPDDVDALLARGCVGVTVPAGALAGPARLEALAPVLERVQARKVPLFVHPGRAPGQPAAPVAADEPGWWRPLTDYVWQMQAAWYTFAAYGRGAYSELRVIFAMLAGGAPMHVERFAARGGPRVDLHDPNTFYETSSYGPQAVGATAQLVGQDQLVYGTDRPVIEPLSTGRDQPLQINSANLLTKVHV